MADEGDSTASTNTAIVAVLAIVAVAGTVIFMKKKEAAELEYADYQQPTDTNVNITTYPGIWPWPVFVGRYPKYRSSRWWWRDRVSDWYYLPRWRWGPDYYYSPRYPPRHRAWPRHYHDWYERHPGPRQSRYPIPGEGGRTGGQPISYGEGTRGLSQ